MKYVYILALVKKPDPEVVSLSNSLFELATGEPSPDIIPSVHPSSISFKHAVVEADDDDEAYLKGQRELDWHNENGVVCNDYVIPVPAKETMWDFIPKIRFTSPA